MRVSTKGEFRFRMRIPHSPQVVMQTIHIDIFEAIDRRIPLLNLSTPRLRTLELNLEVFLMSPHLGFRIFMPKHILFFPPPTRLIGTTLHCMKMNQVNAKDRSRSFSAILLNRFYYSITSQIAAEIRGNYRQKLFSEKGNQPISILPGIGMISASQANRKQEDNVPLLSLY